MKTNNSGPSPVRKAKKLLGRLDHLATEKLKELGEQVKQSFDALMPTSIQNTVKPEKSATRRRKPAAAKARTPKRGAKTKSVAKAAAKTLREGSTKSQRKGASAKRTAKKRAAVAKSKRSAK